MLGEAHTHGLSHATMNVTIVNYYGHRNKGDQSMLHGLISLVHSVAPGAQIHVTVFQRELVGSSWEGCEFVAPALGASDGMGPLELASSILALAAVRISVALPSVRTVLPRQLAERVERIRSSDAVLTTGGPFLRDSPYRRVLGIGVPRFGFVRALADLWIARWCGVPVWILGQSIGPMQSRIGRALVRSACRAAREIVVRESRSLEHVQGWLGARLLPDLAFLSQTAAARPRRQREIRVGLNLRYLDPDNLAYLAKENGIPEDEVFERYSAFFRELAKRFAAMGVKVVAVAQARGNDARCAAEILRGVPGVEVIQGDGPESLEEFVDELRSLDFVVATRYHCALVSIREGVPVMAFAYSGKVTAAIGDYGLRDLLISADTLSSDCGVELVLNAFGKRAEIKERVRKAAAGVREQCAAGYSDLLLSTRFAG